MVPLARLELAHPCGYQILSLGCLPIPSQRQIQLVGIVGLEPTRPLGHQILSLARLPIPPYPHSAVFVSWFRKPDQHTHSEGVHSLFGSITE